MMETQKAFGTFCNICAAYLMERRKSRQGGKKKSLSQQILLGLNHVLLLAQHQSHIKSAYLIVQPANEDFL